MDNTVVLDLPDANLEGGVSVLATYQPGNGVYSFLVTNLKWRMDRTTDITITLPAGVPTGSSAYYVIDSTHSNYYDMGSGTGELESLTPPDVVDGTVTLTLEPRSVHLFQLPAPVIAGQWGIPR